MLPKYSRKIDKRKKVYISLAVTLIAAAAIFTAVFNLIPEVKIPLLSSKSEQSYKKLAESSRGDKALFRGVGNASRDLGIEAIKKKNYSQAVKYFQKAVKADRNDPEVLIYYNNALARQKGDPFTLATVVPIDNNETSAKEMLRGIAQAQHQFNKSNGLNNRFLEIVIANDGNKPERATQVAKQLVKDKSVLGVIGHNSSSATKGGLSVYEKAGMGIISPTSTSTSLASEVFFRTVPSDAAAGKKLASYAYKNLGLDRVVIFYNPKSSYSTSLKNAFEENFAGNIARSVDLSNTNLDAWGEVSKSVLEDEVSAALLFPNTALTSVALEIAQENIRIPKEKRLKLLGGDALYSPKTLNAGIAVEGLIIAVPWFVESPQAQNFSMAASRQWGGKVNWRTATSFDATQAFIKALSPQSSRSTVLARLARMNVPSTQTSGDELQFTPEGERESNPILVQVLKGGIIRPRGSDFGFDVVKD
ncbi:MAG: ABC transporter substrate-binding protein [Nostocaceae cyanobacterium]|nr:ABC transporter substrate-binding protein [Nostocaceae cyanobacterium]